MKLPDYLDQLQTFYAKHSRLPSYREMMSMWKFASINSIYRIINKLIQSGSLTKEKNKIIPTSEFFALPLVGTIQAGIPNTPIDSIIQKVNLNDYVLNNKTKGYFLLNVEGDSMIEAGIMEGDLALIDKNKTPNRGDIVAACIDGEWTLKYYENNGRVFLRAGNGKYANLYPRESLVIGGVLISVIRKYH